MDDRLVTMQVWKHLLDGNLSGLLIRYSYGILLAKNVFNHWELRFTGALIAVFWFMM